SAHTPSHTRLCSGSPSSATAVKLAGPRHSAATASNETQASESPRPGTRAHSRPRPRQNQLPANSTNPRLNLAAVEGSSPNRSSNPQTPDESGASTTTGTTSSSSSEIRDASR